MFTSEASSIAASLQVRLGLADNSIGPKGCAAVLRCLKANQRLMELNLNNNHTLGAQGAVAFGSLLAHPDCKLENLGLSGCNVMTMDAQPLDPHGGSGSVASVGYENAPKEGIYRFSLGLAQNHSLKQLTLADNGINNWGARELAVAMQENTSVVSLALEGNFMEDEWLKPATTLHTEVTAPGANQRGMRSLRSGSSFRSSPPPAASSGRPLDPQHRVVSPSERRNGVDDGGT